MCDSRQLGEKGRLGKKKRDTVKSSSKRADDSTTASVKSDLQSLVCKQSTNVVML